MNRVAALSAKERNELFTLTAEQRGMGTIAIVEKDFWVCWTLKHLFELPEHILKVMRKDYTAMQDMIFGRCPSFEEILTSLTVLEKEINGSRRMPFSHQAD